MMNNLTYAMRPRRVSRRALLGTGAAGVSALALAACSGSTTNKKGSATSSNSAGSAATATTAAAPAAPGGSAASGTGASLIPPGLEQAYPQIAKYHWSKLSYKANATPKTGGRLKVQLDFDTPTWDPFDPSTAGVLNVPMTLFYNRLVKPDMTLGSAFAGKNNMFQLVIKPDLARSWEQPDQQTYLFHIAQNAKFHNLAPVNGRQVTADDVLYTYNAYVAEKAVGQSTIFRDVDKFEATDKFTFKITTKKPIAYLLNSLSAPLAFVIAKEARESQNGLKPDPPIGTGPFVMKQHKFRSTLNVDKNPEYFVQGRPYLDGVDMIWLADYSTALAAYRTGQIDQIMYYPGGNWNTLLDLQKSEGWSREGGKTDIHVMEANAGGNLNYAWKLNAPPFNDVRVRQALSIALDRDKMTTALWGEGYYGQGFPTDWIYPEGKPWPLTKDSFPDSYHYNFDKAKALLSQAGWSADTKLTLVVSSTTGTATGPAADSAALVQEAWKKLGVAAEIQVLDSVAFGALQFGKKFTPTQILVGAGTSAGTDLDDFTYRILRSGQQANYYDLSDTDLDKLLDAQQVEFDIAKRRDLGRQIAQRDFDQVYRLWMPTNFFWEMSRPRVQNFCSQDNYMWVNGWGFHAVEDVWLDA